MFSGKCNQKVINECTKYNPLIDIPSPHKQLTSQTLCDTNTCNV